MTQLLAYTRLTDIMSRVILAFTADATGRWGVLLRYSPCNLALQHLADARIMWPLDEGTHLPQVEEVFVATGYVVEAARSGPSGDLRKSHGPG